MKKLTIFFFSLILSTNILSQTKSFHFKGELKLGFDNIANNFLALTNDKEINGDLIAKYKIYDQENNLLWTRDVKLFLTDFGKLLFSRRPHRDKFSFDVPLDITNTKHIKFQVEICGSVGILNIASQCKYIEKNKSVGWWTKYISRTVDVGTLEFIF